MRGFWIGLKLDFKQIKAGYLKLLLFAISMIILCLAIGVAGNQILYDKTTVEPFGLAIVDEEDSEWTHMIMDAVSQMETVTRLCEIQVTDEMGAKEKLNSGEVVGIITIPPNFVEDVMTGKNTPIIIEKKEGTMLEGIVVDKLIAAGTKLLSAAQVGIYATLDCYSYGNGEEKDYSRLLQEINLIFAKRMLARNQIYKEKEVVATGALSPLVHYLLTAFIVMMMLSLILVMQIIEPLNQNEMLMRYKVAKVKGSTILLQKWVCLMGFNIVLGTLSLGAIAICGRKIDFPIQWHISVATLMSAVLVAGGLAAIGLFVGMLLRGKEAYGLFIFLITLVQAFLAGGIIPDAFLPETIHKLGYFTYNKYAIYILGSLFGIEVELQYYLSAGFILVGSLIGCYIIMRKRGIK